MALAVNFLPFFAFVFGICSAFLSLGNFGYLGVLCAKVTSAHKRFEYLATKSIRQ
jgi:hypothetical protein